MGKRIKLRARSIKLVNLAAVSGWVVGGLLFGSARAQTATASLSSNVDTSIAEIVVTARKIAEDVQKVPEAITTFSADQIVQAQVRSVDDIIGMTPNFQIHHAETAGNFQMSIRGITQVSTGDAPVTMVVDGVTLPYASGFTRPLFDIEQVEVLMGPQGSLYGQNAIGGAIIVTTKQPTNQVEGSIDVAYGNRNTANVTGNLGGPIIKDRVFFRVSGNFANDDGDTKYVLYPKAKANPEQSGNVRGELKALLSDRFTATFNIGAGQYRGSPLVLAPVTLSSGSGIPNVSTAQINDSLVLNQPNQDQPSRNKQRSLDSSLRLVYDAGPATITSVTAYESLTEKQLQDVDVSRFPFVNVDQRQTIRAISEELRAASNDANSRLRWVAGLFYISNHRERNFTIYANLSLLIPPISYRDADAFFVPFTASNENQQLDARAVFGQVSYDLMKDLELTVGGRYDSDPRSQLATGFQPGGAPVLNQQSTTFNQFQPKVSLKYQFLPEANVYMTYAEGFRPGGFNSGVSTSVASTFPAEKTETFEAGLKSALFNRQLILNLAGFFTKYQNQQLGLTQVTANGVSVNTFDVKQTHIKGGEVSLQAKPVKGLDIVAGFGYTDATIKEFGTSLSGPQFSPNAYIGNKVPMVPAFTFNAAVQYEWPITAGLDGISRLDLETKGREYWEPDNKYSQAPYSLVNLKLGVKGDNWEARLYGNNIFNKRYVVIYEDNLFVQAPGGFNFAFLSRKPTYGVDLLYKF